MARNYVTALHEEGRLANTIRQAKVVLARCSAWLWRTAIVDYNPFDDVKIPKVSGQRAIKNGDAGAVREVRGCLRTSQLRLLDTAGVQRDPVL